MQAIDRTEHAELQPSEIQFVVFFSAMVSADIMTPPSIADVGCRCGKIGLKAERRPVDHRISAESQRITVRPDPRVARQNQRTLALRRLIADVIVIQTPQGIKPRNVAVLALLPVNPPETHALLFIRMVQKIEICFQKRLIAQFEIDLLFDFGIFSDGAAKILILRFKKPYAVRRMHIKRYNKTIVVQPLQQGFVVREQIGIPAVARPAGHCLCVNNSVDAVARRNGSCGFAEFSDDVHPVPVHIDRCNGHGDFAIEKTLHQRAILFLRICFIAAPPVAERKFRNQRRKSRQTIEVADCHPIAIAVCKVIGVFTLRARQYLVLPENQRLPVLQYGDAASRDQPFAECRRAESKVKRPPCSFQIPAMKIGHHIAVIQHDFDYGLLRNTIIKRPARRHNQPEVPFVFGNKFRGFPSAIPYTLRRGVAQCALFHPN